MTTEVIDALRTMLEGALEDGDDPEASFKLRTALQLLVVLEEQYDDVRQVLTDANLDEELQENLQTLGYLE